MAKFGFNPANVDASIPILPKDQYEFILGDPVAFIGKAIEEGSDKEQNHGVRFPLVVAEGDKKGKRIFFNGYQHSEGARSFTKGLQMTALGYKLRDADEEARFNTDHANDDWSYDPDTKTCGEGWHAMKGQRVLITIDIGASPNGGQQQKWVEFLPFGK